MWFFEKKKNFSKACLIGLYSCKNEYFKLDVKNKQFYIF